METQKLFQIIKHNWITILFNSINMEKFLKKFPILTSPKFWGIVLFSLVTWLMKDGYITGNLAEALRNIIGLATGVGIADSLARKIGK